MWYVYWYANGCTSRWKTPPQAQGKASSYLFAARLPCRPFAPARSTSLLSPSCHRPNGVRETQVQGTWAERRGPESQQGGGASDPDSCLCSASAGCGCPGPTGSPRLVPSPPPPLLGSKSPSLSSFYSTYSILFTSLLPKAGCGGVTASDRPKAPLARESQLRGAAQAEATGQLQPTRLGRLTRCPVCHWLACPFSLYQSILPPISTCGKQSFIFYYSRSTTCQ